MTARRNGKSYWHVKPETKEQEDKMTDRAFKMVLNTIQYAITLLVNAKDTKRLVALQSCTNKLYEQADTCLSQGRTMTIADDVDPGWN